MPDGRITQIVRQALTDSAVPPDRVRLEITERQMFEDGDGIVSATIADLNSLAVRVGLDDFGSGGCGMSQILALNPAYLKLDKIFVREIGRDSRSTIVLDALIEMSRRPQLAAICKGIERPEQAQNLRDADVGLGQGLLFATPMPAHHLQEFLARHPA
jgi:EAL domain-containing protein (putative c-di-GMP-specific phosphodiesterase class I)